MEINSLIKEYLRFKGLDSVVEQLEQETNEKVKAKSQSGGLIKQLQVNKVPKDKDLKQFPVLYRKFIEDKVCDEKKPALELKQLMRQHNSVLQSGRQIFSIAINCLQQLHNIKDGNSMADNLGETIDNYKVQLGKYNKILSTEGRCDRSELFSENVMQEHK